MDMDFGARHWLVKTARANYWRVSSWVELDDLIQDGYVLWFRLIEHYDEVTELKHMMSLFQRSYTNYLHDLSKFRTRDVVTIEANLRVNLEKRIDRGAVPELQPDEVANELEASNGDYALTTELETMMDLGVPPTEVAAFFELFQSEEGLRRLRARYRRRKGGVRETFNQRLCRLLGFDATEVDVVGSLRSYILGS